MISHTYAPRVRRQVGGATKVVDVRTLIVSLSAIFGVAGAVDIAAQTRVRPVTFNRDIAPIVFEHCARCHRSDGAGPFPLTSYADAHARARLIADVTRKRVMPPWKADPASGTFLGHTHLTDVQIDTISRWVSDGAPEGDPRDLPPLPTWPTGWQLGEPDLVVTWPEPFTVRADGPDFSRTFVLSLPVSSERYVRGFELRPGRSGAIHHANIRVDRTDGSRRLDATDPAPGYQGLLLASAVYPDGHFLGWTPGQVAPLLPEGLAWRLQPGTDLVVEMHFVPTGRPEVVQPSVGLFFGDWPPERTPAMLRLGRQSIDIPAGQPDYVTTDSFVLPVDVDVQALQPHAHYLAREVVGVATLPDGREQPLITIKDWDYRWQHVYRYVTPLSLPRGTRLSMRFVFDNSADNVRNPHQPPRRVSWGQQSVDEMGDLWIQMLPHSARDLETLNAAIGPKHMAEEIVGYEMMIRREPDKVSLRNDVAVMYSALSQPAMAVPHFAAVVQREPASVAARFNLGTALLASGRPAESIVQYEAARDLDPNYRALHNNWGRALLQLGRVDEALAQFQAAVAADPDNAAAHFNIATLLRARNEPAAAAAEYREAIRLDPKDAEALGSLAWLLATDANPNIRNPREALAFAEQAVAIAGRGRPVALDILAAAQAANGRYGEAVRTCDEALSLNPEAALAAALRQRRAIYESGRGYVVAR